MTTEDHWVQLHLSEKDLLKQIKWWRGAHHYEAESRISCICDSWDIAQKETQQRRSAFMVEILLWYLATFPLYLFILTVHNKCVFHVSFCPRGRRAEQFSSKMEAGIVTVVYRCREKCLQTGLLGTFQFSVKQVPTTTCDILLCFWSKANRRYFLPNSGLTGVGK